MIKKIIAIANQKGGVAKTITAINLAAAMRERGRSVLLLDMDPQANATTGLGVDPYSVAVSIFEVLEPAAANRQPIAKAVISTSSGVDLVAGSDALTGIDQYGAGIGSEALLARVLQQADLNYDLVLIDCPPSLGRLTVMAFAAASEVLVPVGPGPDELSAVAHFMDSLETIRENGLNPHIEIGHVILTSYDARNQLSKDVRDRLLTSFPDQYAGEIRMTVRVPESKAYGQPVITYSPESSAAHDYRQLATALIERGN